MKIKKIVQSALFLFVMIAFLPILGIYAEDGLIAYTDEKMSVIQFFNESQIGANGKPIDLKQAPVAIQLKKDHQDNVKIFAWARQVGLTALYEKPFFPTTLPENGSTSQSDVVVYLWKDSGNVNIKKMNLANFYYNADYTTLGRTGRLLVYPYNDNNSGAYYNANLKYAETGYTGTFQVQFSNNKIQATASGIVNSPANGLYEWRYIGFNAYGGPILNPGFPVDAVTTDTNYSNRNHVVTPWVEYGDTIAEESFFNVSLKTNTPQFQKDTWELYFAKFPKYKTVARTNGVPAGEEWSYWRTRLQFLSNPYTGGAVILGVFHRDSDNAIRYYANSLDGPSLNDVVLDYFTIVDKETNKEIDKVYFKNGVEFSSKNPKLTVGKKYIIKGSTTFMAGKYDADKKSSYKPASMVFLTEKTTTTSRNLRLNALNGISITPNMKLLSALATDGTQELANNTPVYFEKEITVDFDTKKFFTISAEINPYYTKYSDNYNQENDNLSWTYGLQSDDMEALGVIRLYSSSGNEVQDVNADTTYYAEVTVGKKEGDKIVKKSTVDFTINYGNGSKVETVKATTNLNPNGTVTVKTGLIIRPTTAYVKISAKINPVHYGNGENNDQTNDSWDDKVFVSVVNFAVKDFKIDPTAFNYGSTQSFPVNETVTFNAKLLYESANPAGRQVNVEIRNSGTLVYQTRVLLYPNSEREFNLTIPTPITGKGSKRYTLEINPVNGSTREYTENIRGASNPYIDNIQTSSIYAFVSDNPYLCEVTDTYNTWVQNFTVYHWRGQLEYYDCSYYVCTGYSPIKDIKGNITGWYCTSGYTVRQTCSYCRETSSWTTRPSSNQYEDFSITNIYFKSKVTEDNNGGWIDALTTQAKIKSGYGFEIKVVTRYTSNVAYNRPSDWSSGCNYDSVSPGYSVVTATRNVTIKMPYTDKFGKQMTFNLENTDSSGSWYNNSQTFELPLRNSFNKKTERKIFINDDASVGTYTIQVDTDEFYGSPDKPYVASYKGLCDRKYFTLKIIGTMEDDLNTHIVQ